MGTYTLNKTAESRLYWLGRYLERVFTCIKATGEIYDATIDGREADFPDFCARLGLPCAFTNTDEFVRRFLGDPTMPGSLISCMTAAHDNAMVERQIIGTDTLSYLEMALSSVKEAIHSPSPKLCLQNTLDMIMAFRGCCDEAIDDDICRNTIKAGASLERVDLYLRLGYDKVQLVREINRLLSRLYKTGLPRDSAMLNRLIDEILDGGAEMTREEKITCVESLIVGV